MTRTAVVLAAALVLGSFTLAGATDVDPKLPDYKPVSGISGSLKSVGSDTMLNIMTYWGELFGRYYGVKPEIEGKGSGTAPPALIDGSATFGPMSRAMKSTEQDAFAAKYGYKCLQMRTAIDMLAVFVHKDNPIAQTGLTLKQLDAIFSKARKAGGTQAITTWGQLGLTGAWKDRPITLYGRNAASGTYGFFKEHVLLKGDYKDSVKEQGGSAGVVGSVAHDLGGIGYSGIGYKTADVATVPLGHRAGSFVAAVPDNAYTGRYPLARFLYLSVNYKPNSRLDPLRREFVRLVYSKQGQEAVLKAGFYPIPASIARAELAKVGL
jgi:phosphate transport system substrate-binding protein